MSERVSRRAPLTERQKQLMLAVLLRRERAFKSVGDRLSPDSFPEDNKELRLTWAVALDHYNTYEEVPSRETLLTEIEARLEEDPDYLTEDQIDALNDFVEMAYEIPRKELNVRVATRYVQQLLEETLNAKIFADVSGNLIADLPAALAEHAKAAAKIQAIQSGPVSKPFPDNPEDLKPVITETTGFKVFDRYMNGGTASGEVIGFCGPYGSCKTTTAIMLGVTRAKWEYTRWLLSNKTGPLRTVYYVSWEESLTDIRLRLLCCAAQIHKDSLSGEDYLSRMSTSENLKPYEKKMFRAMIARGEKVPGERERMLDAMRQLNHNLRVLDFSGAVPEHREPAANMAKGLAAVIENDQLLKKNAGVSMVLCDYAGAAAETAIQYHGWDHSSKLRHLVGKFPMNLKNMVAAPFDCPVWVFHQLGTEANSRPDGVAPKVTDAAEARNFYENVNFGFMVGVPTKEHIVVLTNGKQRRAARQADTLLKIDGAFCLVRETNKYTIEGGKIVSVSHQQRVADADVKPVSIVKDSMFDDVGLDD